MRRFGFVLLILALGAASLAVASPASAESAGEVDPSYNGGQPVHLPVEGYAMAFASAARPGGGSVTVGHVSSSGRAGTYDAFLALVDESGTVERVTELGLEGADQFFDVAVDTHGRIVAMGRTSGAAMLVRYLSDGTLDTDFGNGGIALRADENVMYVALVLDGDDIVVTGVAPGTNGGNMALYRYDDAGQADPTFHAGAKEQVGPGTSIAIDPFGRIMVGLNFNALVARFTPLGDPDPTFGDGGQLQVSGPRDVIANVRTDDEGRTVIGTTYHDDPNDSTSNRGVLVVRLLADGMPDPEFGPDGDGRVEVMTSTNPEGLAVDDQGRIVVAGSLGGPSGGPDYAVIRLLSDGTPDPAFGEGGIASVRDPLDRLVVTDVTMAGGGIVVTGFQGDDAFDTPWGFVQRVLATEVAPAPTTTTSAPPDTTTTTSPPAGGGEAGSGNGGGTAAAEPTTTTTAAPATTTTTPSVSGEPASAEGGSGYWLLEGNGTVHPFGGAKAAGSWNGPAPRDIEATATGNGYWIVGANGTVRSFGDALAQGVRPSLRRGETVVSISGTPTGKGYWLFSSAGRVFGVGDAVTHGDLSSRTLNAPIVASAATPSGNGYYLVAADGGVFTFGDAAFRGSTGGRRLNRPVTGLVPDSDGAGYWLVASDGGVFSFDAAFRGSLGGRRLNAPIVGMVRYGNGYLLVGADGGVFSYSDRPFSGSLGGQRVASPMVGVAALP